MNLGWIAALAALATSVRAVIIPSKHPSLSDAHKTLSCQRLLLQVPHPSTVVPCVLSQLQSDQASMPTASMSMSFSNLTSNLSSEELGRIVRTTRSRLQEAAPGYTPGSLNKGYNEYITRFTSWRVPDDMKGVGQHVGAGSWLVVVVAPLLLSVFIAVPNMLYPLDRFEPINSRWITYPLCLSVVFNWCAGCCCWVSLVHPELDSASHTNILIPSFIIGDGQLQKECMFVFYLLLSAACTTVSFRAAHIEFALPELVKSPFLIFVNLCITIASLAAIQTVPPYVVQFVREKNFLLRSFLQSGLRFGIVAFLPPGVSIVFAFLEHRYREMITFWFWADSTGKSSYVNQTFHYPVGAVMSVYLGLCCCNAYGRDKQFVSLTGFAMTFAFRVGLSQIEHVELTAVPNPVELIIPGLTLLGFGYLCALFGKRQRVFPFDLKRVKFVRIGYLRRMSYEKSMIKRCQDLPADAFGDATKASKIIVISHRWMHRYKCDVATPEYPNGLRLTTMLNKLERYFPSTWVAFQESDPNLLQAIFILLVSLHYGRNDVLIFFDFMCVPQIGLKEDDSLIERTSDENEVFEEALPAMGHLYTMYDVMICPEVVEGMEDYESSGWCFCERESAYLYGKLTIYSHDFLSKCGIPGTEGQDSLLKGSSAAEFEKFVERELQTKLFFFEKDRATVREIVKGVTTCRMLIDAVKDQDVENVQSLLVDLEHHGLLRDLDDPLDEETLDTVLHVAMRLPSKDIVDLLVKYGSDVNARNLAGDTPYECFGIPRFWGASA